MAAGEVAVGLLIRDGQQQLISAKGLMEEVDATKYTKVDVMRAPLG